MVFSEACSGSTYAGYHMAVLAQSHRLSLCHLQRADRLYAHSLILIYRLSDVEVFGVPEKEGGRKIETKVT